MSSLRLMAPIDHLIFFLGLLLEILILWRGLRQRLSRHYAYFYVYLGYVFATALAQFLVFHFRMSAYAMTYWISAGGAVLLRFSVIWEVFRQTFLSAVAARRVVGHALSVVLVSLTAALFFGSDSTGLFFAELERKAGFVQAALLMATLLLARYYATPLGRNIWGMALGLGLYLSVSVMNFAALELVKSFFSYWRFVVPLSFIGMLGVWTWALWSYAPNPRPATAALED